MTHFIGTSGWSYPHWDGVLYPPGTPTAKRFSIYTAEFDTVELNAGFYRWPRDTTFASWYRRLPAKYQFTVKAARGLTHAKKLHEPETWIDRLRVGLHELHEKRGPTLFQLPPGLARDDARLEYFVRRVPDWMRPVIEFRHPSWVDDRVFGILEAHRVAYSVMSGAQLPCVLRATAPDAYIRFHGPDHHHLYGGSYSDDDLNWWVDRIREWEAQGRTVYAYFNNDGGGHAVRNARTLRRLLEEG